MPKFRGCDPWMSELYLWVLQKGSGTYTNVPLHDRILDRIEVLKSKKGYVVDVHNGKFDHLRLQYDGSGKLLKADIVAKKL